MTTLPSTLPELYEILHRQEKILANKSFIERLPDKGEKVRLHHGKILERINKLTNVDESCRMLSALTINPESRVKKSDVENFEWRNRTNGTDYLDSDDDSDPEDPLAIVASATHVKKKVVQLKEDKKLITPEDLKEIEELRSTESSTMDAHTKYISEKTDKSKLVIKHTFKPHKSLKSGEQDPAKEILVKGHKWEVTAATPPPSVHGPVKEISLQESVELHKVHNQHLKEIQMKHAVEKLGMSSSSFTPFASAISDSKYRDAVEAESETDKSDAENSDNEVHDEETKDGGVVFTVFE